jgi:hypothetical protein
MKLAWIVPGLLASLGVVAVPADAAVHFGIGVSIHPDRGRPAFLVARQAGYERGYEHGLAAGARDFQHHERFTVWGHRRYRQADSGYRSRYGPRPVYQQAYRRGFEDGYQAGYGPPHRDRRYHRDWRYYPHPPVR